MAITPLPPAPAPTDTTAQFNSKAFTFAAALTALVAEINAVIGDTNILTLALPLTGGALTGSLREAKAALSASNINFHVANYFTKTITAETTFTVSNAPTAGAVGAFVLELTNGGSQTIHYPSGSKFAAGLAPILTASGKDILACYTLDGGSTFVWLLLAKDVK